MKTAWKGDIRIAVCLLFATFLSGGFAAALEPEVSDPEETLDTYLVQSVDYYAAGDFERSLQAAESALELLDSNTAVAYNNICSAQMRLGAYEQAETACNKALLLAPGYMRAWNNLASVYEKVSEQSPTVGAYLDLSLVRYWQGKLDESVKAAQKVLEIDPNNAIAHNNICAAFARSEKWAEAVQECEIALTIDPDYERAKNNLKWARSREAN